MKMFAKVCMVLVAVLVFGGFARADHVTVVRGYGVGTVTQSYGNGFGGGFYGAGDPCVGNVSAFTFARPAYASVNVTAAYTPTIVYAPPVATVQAPADPCTPVATVADPAPVTMYQTPAPVVYAAPAPATYALISGSYNSSYGVGIGAGHYGVGFNRFERVGVSRFEHVGVGVGVGVNRFGNVAIVGGVAPTNQVTVTRTDIRRGGLFGLGILGRDRVTTITRTINGGAAGLPVGPVGGVRVDINRGPVFRGPFREIRHDIRRALGR
jgi:hypothetical protein